MYRGKPRIASELIVSQWPTCWILVRFTRIFGPVLLLQSAKISRIDVQESRFQRGSCVGELRKVQQFQFQIFQVGLDPGVSHGHVAFDDFPTAGIHLIGFGFG
jgi:hypothetical protein